MPKDASRRDPHSGEVSFKAALHGPRYGQKTIRKMEAGSDPLDQFRVAVRPVRFAWFPVPPVRVGSRQSWKMDLDDSFLNRGSPVRIRSLAPKIQPENPRAQRPGEGAAGFRRLSRLSPPQKGGRTRPQAGVSPRASSCPVTTVRQAESSRLSKYGRMSSESCALCFGGGLSV